ncbi:MAG: hypothetical protein PW999_00590 [Paraburkholderia tropica]|nr:hypothetical protein [Paraburkholderia tropica]
MTPAYTAAEFAMGHTLRTVVCIVSGALFFATLLLTIVTGQPFVNLLFSFLGGLKWIFA